MERYVSSAVSFKNISPNNLAIESTHWSAGQNKEKMKCCVITGRALDPLGRKGTNRSFKRVCACISCCSVPSYIKVHSYYLSIELQHFIKTVEDGLKAVDDEEQDKVCFIYDR